jgi:hypothetical protein
MQMLFLRSCTGAQLNGERQGMYIFLQLHIFSPYHFWSGKRLLVDIVNRTYGRDGVFVFVDDITFLHLFAKASLL